MKLRASSVRIVTLETSVPDPAVVGMAMTGYGAAGRLVESLVVGEHAAVGRHQRDALAGAHGAAAAEGDDQIAALRGERLDAGGHGPDTGVLLDLVEEGERQPRLVRWAVTLRGDTGRGQSLVRADECLAPPAALTCSADALTLPSPCTIRVGM